MILIVVEVLRLCLTVAPSTTTQNKFIREHIMVSYPCTQHRSSRRVVSHCQNSCLSSSITIRLWRTEDRTCLCANKSETVAPCKRRFAELGCFAIHVGHNNGKVGLSSVCIWR